MAREWAYRFYHSRVWSECRLSYGASVFFVCERCGKPGNTCHHRKWLTPNNINDPMVTLSWDNLEWLCAECHNQEHWPEQAVTREGFAFDENGDLIATSPHAKSG